MSFKALHWCERQRVGHAHSKAVLFMLANFADERGSCFPSHEQLADTLEVSVRTIQDCMKRLHEGGFMTSRRDRGADGKLGLTRYRLNLDGPGDNPVESAGSAYNRPPERASGGGSAKNEAGSAVAGDVPPEAASGGPPEEPPAKTTGSSFRSEPPEESTKESIEREARAGDGTPEPPTPTPQLPDADLLGELKRVHPGASHDDQDEIDALWRAMSREDRRGAVRWHEPWMADAAKGRKVTAGLPKYLRQALWKLVAARADEAKAAGPGFAGPFSRAWWWLFWRFVETYRTALADRSSGPSVELARKCSGARSGLGWRVDRDRLAEIEALAAGLRQVATDGGEAAAAREAVRALGAEMPLPDAAPFIWLPDDAALARLDARQQSFDDQEVVL